MIKIHKNDNVQVDPKNGHKYALQPIKKGDAVIKYGYPIGIALSDISAGGHVHSHNLKTGLEGEITYQYNPNFAKPTIDAKTFQGYVRSDGRVGIRNELWVIPTVGCINNAANIIAQKAREFYPQTFAFSHPYGCSQLGDDHSTTQTVLAALCKHPNTAGVLVVGLGCENNHIEVFKKALGEYDADKIKFIVAQECTNEVSEGVEILRELAAVASRQQKSEVSFDRLVVGLKCGGSDGLSGITANPLVGRFCDRLIECGGSAVLSEVPEMFGAETILMNRCVDEDTFTKTVDMINGFKQYFISHDQPIYENPSPGNIQGGITTLEEKSLGCVQKAGSVPVVDVLSIGESVRKTGLSLLYGPGNDMVAVTNLIASGCQLVLFTTGRGTPFGGAVPTIKISTNSDLAKNKPAWIDFNACALDGDIIERQNLDSKFFAYVMDVIDGKTAKNEEYGYREIAIFKNGVTL